MARRGPDDEGFWEDSEGRIRLGFRRLAVLDPSPCGRQPMVSGDGRSVILLNGEILNFLELRRELEGEGVRFRSRSDTEVALEALNRWGVAAVSRFNGMFALAWYFIPERRLLLARDHAGIKPLYYLLHPGGRGIAFASQFDALLLTPWGNPGPVRRDVLRLYLRLHHIPPPYGLLANTFQLEPGQILVVHADGRVERRTWWQLPRDPEPRLRTEEGLATLADAFQSSVRRNLIADVPLGVFLSGGVDSPLVTAFARAKVGPDLRAFTVGNPDWWQDESATAAAYAHHLGVVHRLYAASGEQALATLAEVKSAQHEPFGDFSLLPTLLVSRLAREEVTVALSGDGGDELFFGYERPLSLLRNGEDFRWPWPVRVLMYLGGKYGLGPRRSSVVLARNPGEYYFRVNCRTKEPDLARFAPTLTALPEDFTLYDFDTYRGQRQLANFARYVEFYGQLQRGLKKVDMAAMACSLEVRVPFLDREVIEVALCLDPFDCMRGGTRKAVLRELLAKFVPPESIPVPKKGFAVPLGDWLRGPLKGVVEETLFDGPLYPEGAFDRGGLWRYWQDHLFRRRDLKWGLWTLLMLQWWARKVRDELGADPGSLHHS